MFCYLKHQSLVSMATTVGFKQPGGGRGAGVHLGRGQPVLVVKAGALNVGSLSGQSWCWGKVVFTAVGKDGDIKTRSCSSLVSPR